MIPTELSQRIADASVIAVVTIDDPDDAEPLAQALQLGGVGAIELPLRTDRALEAVRRIARSAADLLVGVGTILTPEQVRAAREAGAAFGMAPGYTPPVLAAADRIGFPFAPGVATPSEIEAAVAAGCRVLKLFPAEPLGGLPYLSYIAAPYRHLGIRFIPLGGVGPASAARYLASPDVLAVGGSWIAPTELIRTGQWDAIAELAREAVRLCRKDVTRSGVLAPEGN